MAIKISFDGTRSAIQPALVLANRNGHKLGQLPAYNLIVSDSMADGAQMTLSVNRADFDGMGGLWESVSEFKLLWAKEWNRWFEIYVETEDGDGTTKSITAKSLGHAELAQTNLYGLEINTEDDIERDDYEPSVLYNEDKPNASIMHRILALAPHYSIGHVDTSIAGLQRSFSFNEKDILSAFSEIAEEINCLFIIECYSNSDMEIVREVNVYDLESYCPDCGERGDFLHVCPKCGSTNVTPGYGKDTSILIDKENLAESIQYSTDNGSVKNCFHLEAGDDLMSATIASITPTGRGEIWYISDEVREDMTKGLSDKLSEYDSLYNEYQTTHEIVIDDAVRQEYNDIVQEYNRVYNKNYKQIPSPIVGYPALMEVYFDTIDFYLYLNNSLMPDASMQNTSAAQEASNLASKFMQYVAVKDTGTVSGTTADSAVTAMAKVIVDNRYQVKIIDSSLNGLTWSGSFKITNYSDEDDTASTSTLTCLVTSDYEKYVKQLIEKSLDKSLATGDTTDIVAMFDLDNSQFAAELKKYSLIRLKAFYDACQGCINILIDNGAADNKRRAGIVETEIYEEIYLPYYNKFGLIELEIKTREDEVAIIAGTYDENGDVIKRGVQNEINDIRNEIQGLLNFEAFLGTDLWLELAAYRRDDTYKNQNYVSDGLDNSQIFKMAMQFIEDAQKDIYKSATLQHSISASMSNLLVIPEFAPIIDLFEIGNWLRVLIDGEVYRLRLIEYQIDFNDLTNFSVTFSDVTKTADGISDVESILNSASNIASSYDFVARQAKRGADSDAIMNNWVENGMSLTNMKIINSADRQDISWDTHGLTCREYIPELDAYDEKQLKIINKGLYLTDDNWLTARAGIGDFIFYDPRTREYKRSYGVIADTIIGNLSLSDEVGIYNEAGSITLDKNGFTLTADKTDDENNTPIFVIEKKVLDGDEEKTLNLMSLDSEGEFSLNASFVNITSSNSPVTMSLDRTLEKLETDMQGYTTSSVQTSNSEILLAVGREYSTKTELAALETSIGTQLSVVEDGLSVRVSETQTSISNLDGRLQGQINDITANFRFTSDGQYIGVEGSNAVMHLYNDIMEIIVSDNPVTTVDRNGLAAAEASISTLHMGEYLWSYDPSTGHLTLS